MKAYNWNIVRGVVKFSGRRAVNNYPMKYLFLFFLCLTSLSTSAIDIYSEGDELFVLATSGLRMREAPVDGSSVVSIPYGAKVKVLKVVEIESREEFRRTYDGISGTWPKVEYKGKVGYVFDGFLCRLPAPKLEGERFYDYLSRALTPVTSKLPYTVISPDEGSYPTDQSSENLRVFKFGNSLAVYHTAQGFESYAEHIIFYGLSREEAYLLLKALHHDKMEQIKEELAGKTVHPDCPIQLNQEGKQRWLGKAKSLSYTEDIFFLNLFSCDCEVVKMKYSRGGCTLTWEVGC